MKGFRGSTYGAQTPAVDEQRQEFRLTGRIWVEVEVEAADGAHERRVLRCGSSDLSANGLRLQAPETLPEGAILPLVIHLGEEALQLMGQVKWCIPEQPGQTGGCIAGFELFESDQTSILQWKDAIAALLET